MSEIGLYSEPSIAGALLYTSDSVGLYSEPSIAGALLYTSDSVGLYSEPSIAGTLLYGSNSSSASSTVFATTPIPFSPISATDISIVNCVNFDVDNGDRISILEKINRLTDLYDPWKVPLSIIQNLMNGQGYDLGVNRDDLFTDFTSGDVSQDRKKYIRFMTDNLNMWYRAKTSRPSISSMLYSFGIVGKLVHFFCTEYTGENKEIDGRYKNLVRNYTLEPGANVKDVFTQLSLLENEMNVYREYLNALTNEDREIKYKELENLRLYSTQITETFTKVNLNQSWFSDVLDGDLVTDFSTMPNDSFPTPHFGLLLNLNKSVTNWSSDLKARSIIEKAIESIRPINTVFRGILAYFNTSSTIYMAPYTTIRKHIILNSDFV